MSRWMTYSFILGFAAGGYTQNTGEGGGGGCLAHDGREGACVKLVDCPSLFSVFETIKSGSAPPDATQILVRSLCINKTFVCCPGLQKESVLPEKCGFNRLSDRVVYGVDASLGGWPWIVILKGRRSGGGSVWFCGGSLISHRYVLTTAHCFSDPKIELQFARIGEYNLAQDPDCVGPICAPSHQDIPVEKIIIHPSYNSTCKECNDIALLRLSTPATLDRWAVMPICLPRNLERDAGFTIQNLAGITGQPALAAGWGSTDQDRSVGRIPDILQEVRLPIVETPFCRLLLKKDFPDPSMVFCAGGGGQDTCRGDSGGPVTITNGTTNEHILIGITSLGPLTCGARHTSGLYTNVRHYMPWIVSSMMP